MSVGVSARRISQRWAAEQVASSAESYFWHNPQKYEVRQFAETKAISNDSAVAYRSVKKDNLDVGRKHEVSKADKAPPLPTEIVKEVPGSENFSTLSRFLIHTEEPTPSLPSGIALRPMHPDPEEHDSAMNSLAPPDRTAQLRLLADELPVASSKRLALLKMAMEFDSEDALKKYLEEHPDADKSLHSVKKKEDKGHGKDEEDEDFGNLGIKLDRFLGKIKGLGSATSESIKKAPAKVQSFVTDPEERKQVMSSAADTMKKAPGVLAKNALKAAKELGEEYKTAGKGVGKVFRGEELSKHDKKAMFNVGVSMAAVAIAGATGGSAIAAGTFGKGVARHIAVTAVHAALGELNILGEAGEVALHLGEGAMHLMSGGAGHHASLKTAATEDEQMAGFTNLIIAKTHDEMKKGMKDDVIHKVLKEEPPEGAEKYEEDSPKSKKDSSKPSRDDFKRGVSLN